MKKKSLLLALALVLISNLFANNPVDNPSLTANFVEGDPNVKSMNAIDFGPEGILFVGDSKNAMITAIDTKDNTPSEAPKEIKMTKVDEKIAALLGTTADQVTVQDMAVNPVSKMIYLAVHHSNGTPVLLKTDGEELIHVPLSKVSHSKMALSNPLPVDAKDRRGRALRRWTVSDLNYYDGKVMISGLSNEEFASTFRSINFPFDDNQMHSTLEIYHAAHGQYETHSPIKTFLPVKVGGVPHIVASYTCTPLVIFPIDNLKEGQHTKGKTIAELGNRNTPLDIITIEKNGKSFLVMANSSRAVMKIEVDKIANYTNFLTDPVRENSATAGVEFINLPYVNVQQLDKISDTQVLMLQRKSNGNLDLFTQTTRRI